MCGNTLILTEIEMTEGKATFHTLETWIDHNAMRCYNFYVLPYALP